MTLINQVYESVKEKRARILSLVTSAASESYPNVAPILPKKKGEPWSAVQSAKLRWAMLGAGFTHKEIGDVSRRLWLCTKEGEDYAAIHPPADQTSWVDFVQEATVGPLRGTYKLLTLRVLDMRFAHRLAAPILNDHEKTVFNLAKRMHGLLSDNKEENRALIEALAQAVDVQPQLIYRVMTGGAKVPKLILSRILRAVSQFEKDVNSGETIDLSGDALPDVTDTEDVNEDIELAATN